MYKYKIYLNIVYSNKKYIFTFSKVHINVERYLKQELDIKQGLGSTVLKHVFL